MFEEKQDISIILKYLPKTFITYKGKVVTLLVEKPRHRLNQVIKVSISSKRLPTSRTSDTWGHNIISVVFLPNCVPSS